MSTRLTFLGTGGGRHTTMFQARSTGGFLLESPGGRISIDPGPGAVNNMCQIAYNIETTDAVVISHCHPDHCSDAEVVVEGMTKGGWVKRGSLYGSASVMDGEGGLGPKISKYHRGLPSHVFTMRPEECYDIAGIRTEITRSDHSDPTNVGFKFHTENGILAYVSDTAYSDKIADQYKGVRAILLPVTTPNENRIKYHLCTVDAIKFIERVKPELAIFVHLGIVMLKQDPVKQAAMAQSQTGIRTIAAEDLMTLDMDEHLTIGKLVPHKPTWNDAWNL
jgi:phosphoribosyl 1,2-cyclic phosphodiesterase